ncbi:hypothetical protein GCM10022261_26140 [Brevibacterium daeguense]|uniref:TIGR01906 family membrane protein n=1 Tax=Brevibacterium daeguense TaxID=909936 RepID=A0ABP8EMC2_9MICO
MATDEPKNTDDLMSRRLSSGSEPNAAARSGDSASGSHLEDTQAFDPLHDEPEPTREVHPSGASPAAAQTSAKPAMLSDEEWAMLSGTGPAASPAASGSAARTSAPSRSEKSRDVDVPESRGFGVLDVIGTIWITLAMPFVLAALAVRAVASGFFLKFEYFYRPGFPADNYGFTPEDRLHYGSYVVDYLNNLDSSRYLSDVVLPNGVPVFGPEEISHMADVKSLVTLLYLVAIIAAIVGIVFALYLSRRTGPGIRHGIRFGAILTLLAAIAAGVLAFTGWDQFFTGFHALFFEEGTWQFYLDDALIRLFPAEFWMDAGIAVGVIVLLGSLLPLILTFVGARRRRAARSAAA